MRSTMRGRCSPAGVALPASGRRTPTAARAGLPGGCRSASWPGNRGRAPNMVGLPSARGELSAALLAALTEPPHALDVPAVPAIADPIGDEDLQLALYLCYELHYRG